MDWFLCNDYWDKSAIILFLCLSSSTCDLEYLACLFSGKVDAVSLVENWLVSQWQKAETLSTLATLLSHVYCPFEIITRLYLEEDTLI